MNNIDIINELSKRYKELQEEFKSVQDLVNDIDFVFDYTEEEQHLFYKTSCAMEEHCGALLKLIRFLKKQEREEQGIKDWTQFKKTDSTHIGVDVSDEGDHGACCQVCGDDIATHHCGQDATCQVGDGSAVVNEISDSIKSLEGMQVIKVCSPKCKDCPCGDGLREYPSGRDASSCVKVELVGGYYICLAPLPNSIVTE